MVRKIFFSLALIIELCSSITLAQPQQEQNSNFKKLKLQAQSYYEIGEFKKCFEFYEKALGYAPSDKESKDGFSNCKKLYNQTETKRKQVDKRKRKEADELAEVKRKQKEADDLAEAMRKQKEADELAEAKRKQKEADDLAEAIRKQKEADDLAEMKRKQKEADDLAEVKRKQKEVDDLAEMKRKQKEADEKKHFFGQSLLSNNFEFISMGYSLNYLQNNKINKNLNRFGEGIFVEFFKYQSSIGENDYWQFLWHLFDRNLPTTRNDLRVTSFGFIQPHIGPAFSINYLNIYTGIGLENKFVKVSEDLGKWLKKEPIFNYSKPNKNYAFYNSTLFLNPSIILKIDKIKKNSDSNFGVTFNYLFKSIKPVKTDYFSNISTFTFSFQYGIEN